MVGSGFVTALDVDYEVLASVEIAVWMVLASENAFLDVGYMAYYVGVTAHISLTLQVFPTATAK